MNYKFQRAYTLTVQGKEAKHVISYPLTLDFKIQRTLYSGLNNGHFEIYNLKKEVREDIYKDAPDARTLMPIKLEAGYLSRSLQFDEEERFHGPVIFRGTITSACSYRASGTDIITEIEADDGAVAVNNARVKLALYKDDWIGPNFKSAIRALAKNMEQYGVTIGAVGSYNPNGFRGVTWDGLCWPILKKLAGGDGSTFIDLEKLHILRNHDALVIPEALPAIDDSIGMIGTPRKKEDTVDFKMVFEPGITTGQIIEIKSTILGNVNGIYRVQGFSHQGMISKAKCGECVTNVTCVKPNDQAINPITVR